MWTTAQEAIGSSMAQTPQGESVAKPGTHPLIILSLVCESDTKETHGKLSNALFGENTSGKKILGRWLNLETASHALIIPY